MSYKLLAKVEIQEDKSEDAVINAILGACTKRLIGQLQGLEKKWREVTGVVQGLAFLHTSVKQVIYRDFKCSNILLDGSYNAKISDFKCSNILLDGSYNAKISDFGLGGFHGDSEIMGTYGYAAPEYMALGGFASNNKTAVGMNIVTNKEASQKLEDPEVSFIIEINTGNTSMCQIKEATKGNDDNPKTNHAKHKRKEKMGRFSSSLATLTFPLFMFLTILGHPLKETQGYHSILVCLFAMFNLIAFIFAVSVMILVRARFTWMQITIMLISGMAIPVAHSNLLMEAPILTISLLWNAQVITSPI